MRHRSFQSATLILVLFAFGSLSCRHKVASAPIPDSTLAAAPVRAAAAPTITLTADRQAINRGQSATLTVTTQNATSVTIQPSIGTIPVNGSRQVNPTSSVTYMATAIGPGGTAGDSVRLTVNEPAAPTNVALTTRVTPVAPAANMTLDQQIARDMQPVLFDYDKSDIRPDQASKLQTAAAFLKQNASLRFTVEGHCDERGSEEYNLALGDRRANAVKQYLIGQGIADSRLATVSYGEERPVCQEKTEECYTRNRHAAYSKLP